MNFGDFEAHVRSSMNDSVDDHDDARATWLNAEIVQWTHEAIANYSQHFSYEKTGTISVVAGTRNYSLPSDIIQPPDAAIEDLSWQRPGYQRDHLGEKRMPPGSTEGISLTGTGKGYRLWGNELWLEDEPSARDANYDIIIWYRALHDQPPTPVGATTWTFDFTVPDADMELMFWYVTSMMMGKLEADDSFLRQYADREDLGIYRDDNPARKSATYRMKRYDDGIAIRLAKKKSPRLTRARR